jgi:NitT/TauT family transport system substrate-binding protein
MEKAKSGQCANDYQFTISGTADEIVPKVISGDVDIALVPANVASVLSNKTNGDISIIDINTLGVLSVVTGDSSIKDFSDLAGHTVYMTGKGSTPEYVMEYLLDQAGIADQVTLEFKSEATEVSSALAADPSAIGVLPEPYTTAVTTKNSQLKSVVSLTDVWNDVTGGSSQLVTGVTIVRNEFLTAHPDVVQDFISEQSASVDAVNADPAGSAQGVVDAGIVDSVEVAEKAIPNCQLVCITGSKMSKALGGYYNVLYSADPSSVGGSVPTENMYYLG